MKIEVSRFEGKVRNSLITTVFVWVLLWFFETQCMYVISTITKHF